MELMKSYTIAYKGMTEGEHNLSYEVDDTLFAAIEGYDIESIDCKVDITMKRSTQMLSLDVTITGSVVVECDRCLDDCSLPVAYQGELLVKFSNEVQEYDGEVMWLSPAEDTLDLSQYIYESIILSLPYQRVHAEGECNEDMLQRFQIVSEDEFEALEQASEQQEPQSLVANEKLQALKKEIEAEEQDKEL